MKVTVNGKDIEAPDGSTIRQLIEQLGLTEGPVAVELNRDVVPRAEHAARTLSSGDALEIVHFVGGG
jgi:sulfur carrier protein